MFATIYDYRWYSEGRYIAILQGAIDTIYDFLEDDLFLTPTSADTDAILLRHTVSVTAPSDETTDLGISRELAMAIVHYVKSKLVEDTDKRMNQWHYNKFLGFIQRHNMNHKTPDSSRAMPHGIYVLK